MRDLTDSTYKAATASGVVLLDFWAPWCAPCRALQPVLEQLEKQSTEKASFYKVNIDKEVALAAEHSIKSIPTLVILKDGAVVRRFIGGQSADVLQEAIEGLQ